MVKRINMMALTTFLFSHPTCRRGREESDNGNKSDDRRWNDEVDQVEERLPSQKESKTQKSVFVWTTRVFDFFSFDRRLEKIPSFVLQEV